MELGTFGAILGFAIHLEKAAAEFYEAAVTGGPTGLDASIRHLCGDLARGSQKRLRRLEQARRELVAEMILESISGLDGDDYTVEPGPVTDPAGLLHQAQALERAAASFYRDAAAKMPIREVVRLFERLAQENEQRIVQL